MPRPGTWPSAQQIADAAVLRYFDRRPDAAVAADLGICRRTLLRWKSREDYQAATATVARGVARGLTRYQVDGLGPQLAAQAAQLEHRPRRRRQWMRRRRQSSGSVAWEWLVGEG